MIAPRREETGVLVMELSEHFWPEDLESAVPPVHDIARSPQNPLLLLVVVDSDFDTPLWDFLGQILQPGILAQNLLPECQEGEARAWLLSFALLTVCLRILDNPKRQEITRRTGCKRGRSVQG